MDKEAMGRLILEASTGMHGDVAKQLSDAWTEMASKSEALADALADTLSFVEHHSYRWDVINGKHPADVAMSARAALAAVGR